jgi:hypothetical protein
MLGTAAWATRRSKPAAATILVNALEEGTLNYFTQGFPTELRPLVSFRTHVRVRQVGGPLFLALSYFVLHAARAERSAAIFWGLVSIVLNGLSHISDQPQHTIPTQPD